MIHGTEFQFEWWDGLGWCLDSNMINWHIILLFLNIIILFTSCTFYCLRSITTAPGFSTSLYSTSVINAVQHIAVSLHNTLQQYCGEDYTAVCEQLWNSNDRAQVYAEKLRNNKFISSQRNDIQIVNGTGMWSTLYLGDILCCSNVWTKDTYKSRGNSPEMARAKNAP